MADFLGAGSGATASVALSAEQWDQILSAVRAGRHILPSQVAEALRGAAELARQRELVGGVEAHSYVDLLRPMFADRDPSGPELLTFVAEGFRYVLQFNGPVLVGALVFDDAVSAEVGAALLGGQQA